MTVYSHSQLSTYENCPYQYKLVYIDKVETETEGVEAFMGSRVHETLEKLYRDLKVTRLNTLEELLDFYRQNWEKNWNSLVRIVRKDYSADDYFRLGEKCIKDYYQRYAPFDQGKTLGLEEYVYFSLDKEKDLWIRGYIDRVSLLDSSILEIHDYKTSNRLPPQEDAHSDRQLALYQIGVGEKWQGIQEVRLIWHYLTFDTEIRSSRTPDQLLQLRQETIDLIQKLETNGQFLPKEGPLCDWCNYQALCPKRKHLIDTNTLPANEYLHEPGVSLVNRYVELKEKKRIFNEEADAELAKVEEALFDYARGKNVEAVFGSDHVAKINPETKEKYPLKNDPRRRMLDEVIKKAGKWMEVSDLNPWMLARVISRAKWPLTLLNQVRGFSIVEENRSITLTKLKERE